MPSMQSASGFVQPPSTLMPACCSWPPFAPQVGLLDIDICGPSVPKLLGLEGEEVHQSGAGWSPVYVTDNLGVMSIGTGRGEALGSSHARRLPLAAW